MFTFLVLAGKQEVYLKADPVGGMASKAAVTMAGTLGKHYDH